MSARLCKATFQILQFLAFLFTFRVLRINLVHFLLTVAAHGTVFSLIVIPKSTDGSIGTVLTEAFAHLSHLITHFLMSCIRQRHIDIIRHYTSLHIFIAASEQVR